ncbi:hypothetical protein L873DRAFT_61548 [Choiromyces venosus 120613-1]|uniref:Uncharacterized protein n=1 Tax=Choiromyces venosus 120613-1 TaxID=1336337 RepID=A0A3N4JHV4_9PEZI|nr:hypothetical protein L873DRAFT_61548 [Choiromyces venosus 120613-1]
MVLYLAHHRTPQIIPAVVTFAACHHTTSGFLPISVQSVLYSEYRVSRNPINRKRPTHAPPRGQRPQSHSAEAVVPRQSETNAWRPHGILFPIGIPLQLTIRKTSQSLEKLGEK